MSDKMKIDTDSELKLIKAIGLASFIKASFLGREYELVLDVDHMAGLTSILGDVEMLIKDVID